MALTQDKRVPDGGRLLAPRGETSIMGAAARRWGFILGVCLFIGMLAIPLPDGMSAQGQQVAAISLLMVTWWITEVIPLPATSLIPLLLFPSFGIMSVKEAASAYADPVVFLLVGGFLIAAAMERWGLHKRLALSIVAVVGTNPRRIVLGFMLGTAFVSGWVTNTAATMMVLPVALSILTVVDPQRKTALGTALVLGVAYAASIGGITTLIGTTPNVIFAAAAAGVTGERIGFLEWMCVSLPLAAVLLAAAWFVLVRVAFVVRSDGDEAFSMRNVIQEERRRLGRMSSGELLTAIVLTLTAFAWFVRAPKEIGNVTIPGLESFLPFVTDATIAIAAGLLLFALPVSLRRMEFVLDWDSAVRIPWGILWLLGGGLCLANGFEDAGLSVWLGARIGSLGDMPDFLFLLYLIGVFVLLTEIASNTAAAVVGMPIVASLAAGVGANPVHLMAAVTYAVSMSFILPVGTPPNAIVFGTGLVNMKQMIRAGVRLSLLSIVLTSLTVYLLFPLIFD